MNKTLRKHGSCLCKKVQAWIEAPSSLGACHCSMCRKWSGGLTFSVNCGTDVEFEGLEHVKVFDSSPWAQRAFCGSCGCNLYYRLQSNGHYYMMAGFFDDLEGFDFDHQIFIDHKPQLYSFREETKTMTQQEVFESVSSSSS
ncbi:MAG: GFA family protein [Bdellovibrionales bacterium]|nr:GFA family protein [Bdellovibrionales bacterium]